MHVSKSDRCAGSLEDLSRRKLPDAHLVNQAKGSLLLNLPRMNYDLGDLEARIPRDTYRAQLSGIEPDLHFIQGKSYRFTDGCFGSPAETATRIRPCQPHEMPSSFSYP